MSFTSIFIPLLGLLIVYYAGMIVYDTYLDNLKNSTSSGNSESEIDISSELEGFTPIDVNRKPDSPNEPVAVCCGLRVEELCKLMENAAYGRPVEGLDNITYKCLAAAS